MNCLRVQSLLPEFEDDLLPAGTAWQVQSHLSDCDACGTLCREQSAVKQMLQALPTTAPSAGFDAALAQRLALTRRPAATPVAWHAKLGGFWSSRPAPPSRLLRPALALSFVLAAGTFAAFFPGQTPVPPTPAVAVHASDPAFVADCVAQHHRDAAAEPLADPSAQTLAGSLDSAPADTNTPPDSGLL